MLASQLPNIIPSLIYVVKNPKPTQETDALNPLIANPITEAIQVEIADSYAPILIDLHNLLGGGHEFRAWVEDYGVADIDLINKDGMMFLSANPEALDGACSRIVVSALDDWGDLKTSVFDVEAILIGYAGTQVA